MAEPAKNYTTPMDATAATPPPASATETRTESGHSVTGLLRHLVDDVAMLLRKELALAASEVSSSVNDVKKGVSGMLSGGAVLYAGLIYLLGAATLGLAYVVEPWLAALIVGGVVTLIGLVMMQSGKKKLEAESFVPDRTTESLRKDKEMVRRESA